MSGERRAPRRGDRVALFIAAAAAIMACEPATDPLPLLEKRLLIHGVLDMASRRQVISVRWTGTTVNFFEEPVKGATVSITGPDGVEMIAVEDSVNLSAPRRGNYHVDLDAYGATLVPGGTYTLRVNTTTGESASGTTIIPDATQGPYDSTYARSFRRSFDTLRLVWPRVPGAKSYLVTIRSRVNFGNGEEERFTTFADTTVTVAGNARWFESEGGIFIAGDSTTVVVAAVDDNYYTYYHTIVDPFAGAPPTRLTGGLGVFASLVPLMTRRYRVTH